METGISFAEERVITLAMEARILENTLESEEQLPPGTLVIIKCTPRSRIAFEITGWSDLRLGPVVRRVTVAGPGPDLAE